MCRNKLKCHGRNSNALISLVLSNVMLNYCIMQRTETVALVPTDGHKVGELNLPPGVVGFGAICLVFIFNAA